jgi:hypothetical protein
MEASVQLHIAAFSPERARGFHWIVGLDVVAQRKFLPLPGVETQSSIPKPRTILNHLSRFIDHEDCMNMYDVPFSSVTQTIFKFSVLVL